MSEASSTGPFTLRVNLTAIAGAPTGTVTVAAPGAVSCGPNCYTIPIGTVATLTETPHPSGSGPFTQWGGDCAAAGSAAQCTVTMTTDRTATAYFRSTYNLMFYTTTVYEPAALGVPSLATADGYCAARAAAGHLGGTKWLAWLSTSSVNAASRLSDTGGWLRTDGKLFATDLTSLITAPYLTSAGTVYYPPRVDEFGSEAASPTTPTTGTHVDGTASAGQTCNDFTDPTQPSPLLGETTRSSVGWTENQTDPAGSCGPSLEFPIYCFEADFSATPPKPQLPASSRIAFVTRGYFDASSGVSGADGLCASEASSAHLSGTFIALLATSTASATSRLSLTGPNWYRPDGVQITNTPADLANGTIHASINVTADGAGYFGDVFTFTGGQTVPGSPSAISATCQDWTSNSSTLMAPFGSANESYVWFWTGGGASCALGAPVFCVQQ